MQYQSQRPMPRMSTLNRVQFHEVTSAAQARLVGDDEHEMSICSQDKHFDQQDHFDTNVPGRRRSTRQLQQWDYQNPSHGMPGYRYTIELGNGDHLQMVMDGWSTDCPLVLSY